MKKAFCIALLGLSGCASFAPAPPPPEVIEYRTSACFGTCPVYSVVVSEDGVATFEGIQHTALQGRRQFAIRPQEFDYFKAALEPYRPLGEKIYGQTAENCDGPVATDAPGVEIRWHDEERTDHLVAYFGCNLEVNRAMYQALADAPDRLPLKLYIGR